MPVNEFLPFATGSGALVQPQADYAVNPAKAQGFQAGIADPAQLNKVWRQASVIAAALAQLVANRTNQDIRDDGNIAALISQFAYAFPTSTDVSGFAPINSPALTGAPTAPTPGGGDNSTRLATTAFVAALLAAFAPLNNPALTGAPTAPTPGQGDNSNRLATTNWALGAIAQALGVLDVSLGNNGHLTIPGTSVLINWGRVTLPSTSAPTTSGTAYFHKAFPAACSVVVPVGMNQCNSLGTNPILTVSSLSQASCLVGCDNNAGWSGTSPRITQNIDVMYLALGS